MVSATKETSLPLCYWLVYTVPCIMSSPHLARITQHVFQSIRQLRARADAELAEADGVR